jgi:putative ABC transport system substrate-binding protein
MDRRTFIGAAAANLVAVPLTAGTLVTLAGAQAQARTGTARIGCLWAGTQAGYETYIETLRAGLSDRDWVEGKNLVIEWRFADGKYERLPGFAAELVRLKVDVLVTSGTPATLALKEATSTIPIVMAAISDPVASGVVTSLARPNGNITGTTYFAHELVAKRLEMLRQTLPKMRRVALLTNPGNISTRTSLRDIEAVAKTLQVEIRSFEVSRPEQIERAFVAMKAWSADAVVVVDDSLLNTYMARVGATATAGRIASNGGITLATGGGLMGYSVNAEAMWRRAAYFIDRILHGTKPSELPIEQPTTFRLVLNKKSAKVLGVTFPQSLLARADEVIE